MKLPSNEVMINKETEALKTDSEALEAMELEKKRLDAKIEQREHDVAIYENSIKNDPLTETFEFEALGDYVGGYELKNDVDENTQKLFYTTLAKFMTQKEAYKKSYDEMIPTLAVMVRNEYYKGLQNEEMAKSANLFIKNLLTCSKAYASYIKQIIERFYTDLGTLKYKSLAMFTTSQQIELLKCPDELIKSISDKYAIACDELSVDSLTGAEFARWLQVVKNEAIASTLGIAIDENKEKNRTKSKSKDKTTNEVNNETNDGTVSDDENKSEDGNGNNNTSSSTIEPNYKRLLEDVLTVFALISKGRKNDVVHQDILPKAFLLMAVDLFNFDIDDYTKGTKYEFTAFSGYVKEALEME